MFEREFYFVSVQGDHLRFSSRYAIGSLIIIFTALGATQLTVGFNGRPLFGLSKKFYVFQIKLNIYVSACTFQR